MQYVLLDRRANFGKLHSVRADQFKVLTSDVVVILLHLLEGRLVRLHQVVDVLVLALFDFVHLNLHAEVQFSPQLPKLIFVLVDQLKPQLIKGLFFGVELLLALLLADINLVVRLLISLDIVIFLFHLLLCHFELAVLVNPLLGKHDGVGISADVLLVVAVVILQMAHFLHEDLELGAVSLLFRLHVSVEIADAGVKLTNFAARIVVKVMDHVFLHLKQVTVQFCIGEFLLVC